MTGHVGKNCHKKKADATAKLKAQQQATSTPTNTILKNHNDPSKQPCNYCGKFGHFARDCFKKKGR